MFDRHDALQLLEYDRWANTRLARSLGEHEQLLPEARRLWAHIVGTSELWYERVAGGDYKRIKVWPEGVPHAELARRFDHVSERWRTHLAAATAAELARRVSFVNSAGRDCSDTLTDIVQHLVNHGTHHRAQIALRLREAGLKPDDLDYIIWRRSLPIDAEPKTTWRQFLIETTYTAPIERIDALLVEHRAHLEQGFRSGLLLASGPMEPRTGGIILARARERAELEAFLERDPFRRENVARYRIVEFNPVKRQDLLAGWIAGAAP
jgi:uncharacterized damage-inducible protein DinB/uncharacterized protein YciI